MQVHWVEDNLARVYGELVEATLRGEELNPRNRPNTEIRPVLLQTSTRWPCLHARDVNYRFALAELIATVCGWDDTAWLTPFVPNVQQFSEDGFWLRGAYGRRLIFPVDQLRLALDHLEVDPDSRQCVLQIWNSAADTVTADVKDRPCNTSIFVKVRGGNVDFTVFRRSADAIWGVPYDHYVFAGLLEIFAALFRATPGRLFQYIDSLHVYKPEAKFYDEERIERARNTSRTPANWQSNWIWVREYSLETLRDEFAHVRRCLESDVVPTRLRYEKPRIWDIYHYLAGGKLPCW